MKNNTKEKTEKSVNAADQKLLRQLEIVRRIYDKIGKSGVVVVTPVLVADYFPIKGARGLTLVADVETARRIKKLNPVILRRFTHIYSTCILFRKS